MVGLFFFIRASVKDRTKQIEVLADVSEVSLLSQMQEYFEGRAYRIANADAASHQVTFQGFVRPSLFLAIFLSFLAAVGLLCFALVLAFLYPTFSNLFLALLLLAPLAGIFYWKRAGRLEQVSVQVNELAAEQGEKCLMTVTAHRDELLQLQQALPYEVVSNE